MVLPQENWGRTARRRDSGKRRASWDRFAGASVCGENRSPLFPRRPGIEENGTTKQTRFILTVNFDGFATAAQTSNSAPYHKAVKVI